MNDQKVFMDTAFLLAVIDISDEYHDIALESYKKLITGKWLIVTTEAILIEIGNGLSKLKWRQIAHKWITKIRKSATIFQVIPVTTSLLTQAIGLYGSRSDKEWGLTDSISFIIMNEKKLNKVFTTDRHFEQAGYQITLDIDDFYS